MVVLQEMNLYHYNHFLDIYLNSHSVRKSLSIRIIYNSSREYTTNSFQNRSSLRTIEQSSNSIFLNCSFDRLSITNDPRVHILRMMRTSSNRAFFKFVFTGNGTLDHLQIITANDLRIHISKVTIFFFFFFLYRTLGFLSTPWGSSIDETSR